MKSPNCSVCGSKVSFAAGFPVHLGANGRRVIKSHVAAVPKA